MDELQEFAAGQRVDWMCLPRGGYGYLTKVPALVVRKTPSGRYTIRVIKTGQLRTVARLSIVEANP